MFGVMTCTNQVSTHLAHFSSFSVMALPPMNPGRAILPSLSSSVAMMCAESLSCSSSTVTMGTLRYSLLNLISDLVRGLTSTMS